jgi:putative oxidoreductase
VKKFESIRQFETLAYTALRIVSGAMFAMHGAQKILGAFSPPSRPPFGSQMWFGGMIELVAGALIAVGFFTRCAAFLASGMMAVAYCQFHWKFQLAGWAWVPLVNHGELAVVYCFLFLFIWTRGR